MSRVRKIPVILCMAFHQPGGRRVCGLLRLGQRLVWFRWQDEVLGVDPHGTALALFPVLDQTDAVCVQFLGQLRGLVLAAVHQGHSVLLSEIDVDPPINVHPAVAGRPTHTVQQKAIEDFGLNGHALVPKVGENRFWDVVEAVLFRLVAIVVQI